MGKYRESFQMLCQEVFAISTMRFDIYTDGSNEFIIGESSKRIEAPLVHNNDHWIIPIAKYHLSKPVEKKVGYEALANHFHLYVGKIRKKDYAFIKNTSINIANFLLYALNSHFPEKKFIVFTEINFNEGIVIRFHQQWDDEKPYYTEDTIRALGEKNIVIYHIMS